MLQCSVQLKICLQHIQASNVCEIDKKHSAIINRAGLIGNGCIHDEKGPVISFQLEIFFSNVKWFRIGLRHVISERNHMCQCSACFMEDRYMFIGFVIAYGEFIWLY